MAKRIFLLVTFLMLIASSVYALPTLLVDQATKMKFTNFENVYDLAGELVTPGDTIDVGYKFAGVFTVTTIGNVSSTNITWANLGTITGGTEELTGYFQYEVSSVTYDNDDINVQFTMANDDFIRFYFDDTNYDFDVNVSMTAAELKDIDAIGSLTGATNGDLYFEVTGSDYLAGYSDQDTTPITNPITNYNWMNLTINETGYTIVSQIWPDTSGVTTGGSPAQESDLYLESKINILETGDGSANFDFRSEDPIYLYATPEPATFMLFGFGLLGFAGLIRKKS